MTNTVSNIVSDQTLNAIIYIESAGNPGARAKTSTATGLGQFLKGTWRDTVRRHRPDVFRAYPDSRLLALRTNASFSIEMLARFTEDNLKVIGRNATPGDLYLAHFLGSGDAKKLYRADPSTPVSTFLSAGPINANPSILRGKTAGQVRKWADDKMVKAAARASNYVAKYYTGPFEVHGEAAKPSDRERIDGDAVENVTNRPGLKSGGDARLYDTQTQLRAMNYNPGGLDGVWGGGTAGAIAAFLNDYDPSTPVPTTWQAYDRTYETLDALVDRAEAERFVRPVTKGREEADPKVVESVAPEIVPAKRGFWASIAAFFSAVGTTVYQGFQWLLGYRDEANEWGLMYYLDKVPSFVWFALGSAVLGFVVFTAIRTVRGIEKPVTTGERM